ncbi:MAG: ATP-grasp domain-containing protein, partial [Rhodothermales bacterium]|nr:ATP-grasp domain-containing protein [Rhodothermales bacterium]
SNGFDAYEDVYAEWDDDATIAAIEEMLLGFGDVVRLEAREGLPTRLRETEPDIVFNIAEGIGGTTRESYVPTFCEFWGIPYTGSDPMALATCLDKARAKEVLSYHGVPTPDFVVARRPEDLDGWAHEPCIVKPLHEGSSKGIMSRSFCNTREEAAAEVHRIVTGYGEPAIVERYLPGREFTVAILGDGATARALPIVELDFGTLPAAAPPIYSFEAKWIWDRPESPLDIFKCPANCELRLQQRIEEITLRAFHVLRCRDWARIDVRCDSDGEPHVLEVNPLPGIIPDPDANSCYPKAARAAGLSYSDVIETVLRSGAERYGLVISREK